MRRTATTVGVEEEFLLVDRVHGRTVSVGGAVLRAAEDGADVTGELQREQVETGTRPCRDLADLAREIRRTRRQVSEAADIVGVDVAPLATSPLPACPTASPAPRYQRMIEAFGLTGSEQLTCGCHVHVGIGSEEEAVAVLDRIRPWLAPLLALSANSPYWQGTDTGYASYRSQVWGRWPTAGATGLFGTPAGYRTAVRSLLATDTVLDEGMLYFDARVSRAHPTVEIRIADVCREPDDTVLLAALVRGMVTTAADDWRAGRPADPVRTEVLRLAAWQAGRSGVDDRLVDPSTWRPAPAADVVGRLVEHVSPALEGSGDLALVRELVPAVLRRGTGATRQREVMRRTGDLRAVVADAVAATRRERDTG
ncbi:carboxylate-amine ligase [Pseudonocardia saturnea]